MKRYTTVTQNTPRGAASLMVRTGSRTSDITELMLAYPLKDLEGIVSESVGRPEADEPPCDIIQTLNKSTWSRARPLPECVPCKVVRFFILVPNLEAFYTSKT